MEREGGEEGERNGWMGRETETERDRVREGEREERGAMGDEAEGVEAGSRSSQGPSINPFSSGQAQRPHHSVPTPKPDGPFEVR